MIKKNKIAFFDFDGTLTYEDSTTLFFKSLYNSKLLFYYYNYFLCLIELFIIFFNSKNYIKLKNKRLILNLSRIQINEFNRYKINFENNILPKIIKQSGLNKIHELKKNGYEIVIVSASYNFLLEKWCKSLDIFLITNNIFYQYDLIHLNEPDCNYANKVKRIKELYNLNNYTNILAFGDSDGDLEMLKIADEKYYNYFK